MDEAQAAELRELVDYGSNLDAALVIAEAIGAANG